MAYLILKTLLTGIIVVAVSEISKRSSLMAGVLASLPLTSILALVWLYIDTGDVKATTDLSTAIFWMVIPSVFFFLAFPFLVKTGTRFYLAMILSCVAMSGIYWIYAQALKRFGISI